MADGSVTTDALTEPEAARLVKHYEVLAAASSNCRWPRCRSPSHGFVLALILRFLGGVGLAGVHMPGLNLLMDRTDRPYQDRAAGVYTSSYAAGSAGSFLIAGLVAAAFGWRATFVAAGIGPLLSIAALLMLPAHQVGEKSDRSSPPLRALLRNKALLAYVAAFAGNTWEVFAVRVWFAAYLAWTLSLPGNHLTLPSLGLVAGVASLLGVPISMAMAELASHAWRSSNGGAGCAQPIPEASSLRGPVFQANPVSRGASAPAG